MDGSDSRKWELGSFLREYDPEFTEASTTQAQRRDAFLNWKPRAMSARKKLGLPYFDLEGWDGSDLEYLTYAHCMSDAWNR